MPQETQSRFRDDTEDTSEYKTEEVVDATVMRITGAGKFVVYPVNGLDGVKVGNPVRIIVAQKTIRPMLSLSAREERISNPISSNWAIVVAGHESIEHCRVFYNKVQLNTIDHMGEAKSEMRMPRDGSLSFHIPDSMQISDTYLVQVKDGDVLLRSETFGSIRVMSAPQPQPQPMAAGRTTTTTTTTTS